MTVSSTTRKAGPFTGTGAVVAYPFSFKVFSSADLAVVKADTAGVETTLVLNSDYTVSLNADQDNTPGGTITPTVALPTGYLLSITGNTAYSQGTDLPVGGAFNAQNVEDALDRVTILTQQLLEAVGRAVKVGVTSTASPDTLIATVISSASSAAASAAAAAASYDSFDDRYLGVKTSDPTLDNDGNALIAGALYFNSTGNAMRVYNGASWGDVAQGVSAPYQVLSGTGSQTAFTLSGTPGSLGSLEVFISGVRQRPGTDYTWASGTTLTFTSAPPSGTSNIFVRWISTQAITVPADGSVIPAKLANSGYELGMRNRLINGGFRIAQRGTSFTFTSNVGPYFTADRWFGSQFGAGVNDEIISLIADSESTSQYALRINQYKASGFAGGNSRLAQIIESDATADLQGQVCTLSFKHACGTGIPFSGSWNVAVRYDTNDSTLNSAAATSAPFENTGTGITTQQFRAGGLATATYTTSSISFTVPAGARRLAVVFYAANATNNAVLDIKEVRLEKGAVATPFEFRPYNFELAQCQRYYENTGGFCQNSATGNSGATIAYAVPKRVAPTVVFSGITYANANSLTFQGFGNTTSGLSFNVVISTAGGYVSFAATASAEV